MKYILLIILLFKLAFSNVVADVINDIEVKNNDRITKESIVTFSGIKFGNDYSQDQLNQILLDLYDTNFFSDIKFKIEGNTLLLVVERKIIQSIILNGIKAEKQKNLF